jgi:hypothetical protein
LLRFLFVCLLPLVKAEDADLLAIMDELETVEENTHIEEDSLLGGLTQTPRNQIIIDDDERACKIIQQKSDSDTDDEEFLNFTLPLLENQLNDSENSSQSMDIDHCDKKRPDIITKGNPIQLEGIERIHRPASSTVKTLVELKGLKISKLPTVELAEELITEILAHPPQLCIPKMFPQRQHSPETDGLNHAEKNLGFTETSRSIDEHVVIFPLCNPPNPYNIEKQLADFNIPETAKQEVFYGDIDDLSGKQEVGHIVLRILSNKLLHSAPHASLLPELRTIDHIRKGLVSEMDENRINRDFDERTIRLPHTNFKIFLSENSECLIIPSQKPPTAEDAIIWHASKEKVLDIVKPLPHVNRKNSQTKLNKLSNHESIPSTSGIPKRKNSEMFRKCRSLVTTSFAQYSEQRQQMTLNMSMEKGHSKYKKHEKRIQNKIGEQCDSNESLNLTVSQDDKQINRRKGLVSSQKKEGSTNNEYLRKGLVSRFFSLKRLPN